MAGLRAGHPESQTENVTSRLWMGGSSPPMVSYFFDAYGFFELRTEKRSGVPFNSKLSRNPFCR